MLVDSLSDEDNANSLRGGLDVYSMPQKRCMYAEEKLRLTNNVIVLPKVLFAFPKRVEEFLKRFDDYIIRICQIPKGKISDAFSLFITGAIKF